MKIIITAFLLCLATLITYVITKPSNKNETSVTLIDIHPSDSVLLKKIELQKLTHDILLWELGYRQGTEAYRNSNGIHQLIKIHKADSIEAIKLISRARKL